MRARLTGRRIAAAAALLVAAGIIVFAVLSTGSPSTGSAAGNSGTASGAATVKRRNLVQTDTESGTLSYSNPQTVYDRLGGTITWLPQVGRLIKPGQALFRVDNHPVVLMNGLTPAYRDLTPADTAGPDILELNRNLVALGFTTYGIIVDDEWQTATTDAVEALQASFDETETGSLTLGQVVFLPGAQLVSTVNATVGGNGSSGGSGTGGSQADTAVVPHPQFVSLTTTPTTETTTTATTATTTTTSTTPTTTTTTPHPAHGHKHRRAQTLQALILLLRTEIAQLRAEQQHNGNGGSSSGGGGSGGGGGGGSHSGGGSSGGGSSGGGSSGGGSSGGGSSGGGSSGGGSSGSGNSGGSAGQAILQTSSTHLVVTVDLAASSQSEAKVGEHVGVELPDGSTVGGRITAVSPVAQASSSGSGNGGGGSGGGGGGGGGSGSGSGSGSTVPVTIKLSGHERGAGLDQAAVSVNFAQARANHVLSIPVTALVATSGGSYSVQEAVAPRKLLPVTTGLFAAGDVQISGPGIYPGLRVTDSQG